LEIELESFFGGKIWVEVVKLSLRLALELTLLDFIHDLNSAAFECECKEKEEL
jgi:hypothetical protein